MTVDSSIQRIARLTALSAILALIDSRVSAVKPQKSALHGARDLTLAEDVVASEQPPRPIALRDGFPVDAAAFADAGPYAPVPLPLTACRIDAGEPLPSDTDAVLPLDAVTLRGHRAEAVAAVTAGEGVLPAGGDATPRTPLRRAGQSARAIDKEARQRTEPGILRNHDRRAPFKFGRVVRGPPVDHVAVAVEFASLVVKGV